MTDFVLQHIGFINQHGLTFVFFYCVEVQSMYFVEHFLFFPPGAADSQLALPDCEEKSVSRA